MIERIGNAIRMHPPTGVSGRVRPPGSKSLTNRALLCAALADGNSTLSGASLSDDALCMIDGLRSLGVRVDISNDNGVTIAGCRGHLPASDASLDVGHAGTAMRFLTALCCLGLGNYRIDGSERMRQRPIGGLVDALMQIGAGIGYELRDGYPPLTIVGRRLLGGEVVFDQPPSSQFISALLMIAPYAADDVMIRIDGDLPSRPYVEMTLTLMRSLGVESLADEAARFIVPAPQRYQAGPIAIEPDASAATYMWTAAAITGGTVTVDGLTRASQQGDVGFVDVLEQMGCTVTSADDGLTVQGPPRDGLRGIEVDLNTMPDTVQTLAVAALFADGPTTVRNVANLRVKETDRIAALATELTKLGAEVEAWDDGLRVTPPTAPHGARIATYDDHRMAMSLALAGLRIPNVVIEDADCVSKSFPDYFAALDGLLTG